jgi:hypothetical protein
MRKMMNKKKKTMMSGTEVPGYMKTSLCLTSWMRKNTKRKKKKVTTTTKVTQRSSGAMEAMVRISMIHSWAEDSELLPRMTERAPPSSSRNLNKDLMLPEKLILATFSRLVYLHIPWSNQVRVP